MGQTWSSSGEHIRGVLPIDEMVVDPPNGATSRASVRLDANRHYPDAGAKVEEELRDFVGAISDREELVSLNLETRGDPYRYGGLVLLKDNDEQEEFVMSRIRLAQRRILPDFCKKEVFLSWLGKLVLEPVGDGVGERVVTRGSMVTQVDGLPSQWAKSLYQINVMVVRQLLEKASVYKVLVGVIISIKEIVPSGSKEWCDLDHAQHTDFRVVCEPEIEFSSEVQVGGRRVKMIQQYWPERPMFKSEFSMKTSTKTIHPAQVPDQTATDQTATEQTPTRQTVTPTAPGRKRAREQDVSDDDSETPHTPPATTPSKKRTRIGAIPWTDEEKELCVHFYWDHYHANKKDLQWNGAAELWRETFNRNDTAVQLESSRRRFEGAGVIGNGKKCPLCVKVSPKSKKAKRGRKSIVANPENDSDAAGQKRGGGGGGTKAIECC